MDKLQFSNKASKQWITFYFLFAVLPTFGQFSDTIEWKCEAYINAPDGKTKIELGNELMELNYSLDLEEAKTIYSDFDQRSTKTGNQQYRMLGNFILGDVYYYKNQLDSSFLFYMSQAQIAENINDYTSAATGLVNAAFVLDVQGKNLEAIQILRRADKLASLSDQGVDMSSGYFNLAIIFHKMGEVDSASLYIKKVIESDRKAENLEGMVHNLQFLVDLELRGGNLDDARKFCLECLELSEKIEYKRGMGMCQYSMAFVEYQDNNLEQALERIDKAIDIYVERMDSTKMGQLVRLKANIINSTQPEEAEALFKEAEMYGLQAENSLQLSKTSVDLAKLFLKQNKYNEFESQLEKIRKRVQGKEFIDIEDELLDLQYQYYRKQNKITQANEILNEKVKRFEQRNKDLIKSQANYASQFYELFELERELERAEYENEINQLKSRKRTNIFILVGVLLLFFALLGYLAYQNQKNKNVIIEKKALEEKLKSNNLILEKELDALRSQMNPHFLFNSLNSINDYIMHQEPRMASKYLTKFSRLMRTILNNSRKKFVSLSEELEAVELYMEMEKIRFKEKFDFKLEIEDNIKTDYLYIPAMLIQPYLENSVKHGIKHLDGRGLIMLSILKNGEDRLRFIVKDNGVGRQKSHALQQHSGHNRKSFGMEITSSRIDLLNKIYDVNADIEYIDYSDPVGTEVILSLEPIIKRQTNGNLKSAYH